MNKLLRTNGSWGEPLTKTSAGRKRLSFQLGLEKGLSFELALGEVCSLKLALGEGLSLELAFPPSFSLHNIRNKTYGNKKMSIDQTKQTTKKIKSKIISNLFNEKYGLQLGELNNITGTERVNPT